MKEKLRVAVDGPAGTGKSEVCKRLAQRRRLLYVDTGAMYRAAAWAALEREVPDDAEALEPFLATLDLRLEAGEVGARVFIDQREVTELIRTAPVTERSSKIAAVTSVRRWMAEKQKALASQGRVIMEGRDIGTVIMPDAEVKVFLTADEKIRAQRRFLQLKEKGLKTTENEVLEQQRLRDQRDANRADSPTLKAPDATLLDTTQMGLEEVVEAIGEMVSKVDEA